MKTPKRAQEKQLNLGFWDAVPVLAAFDAHKLRCPQVKIALVESARWIALQMGNCKRMDIHGLYWLARVRHGIRCSRNFLPGYAREIEAEHAELRFPRRLCRFDRRGNGPG